MLPKFLQSLASSQSKIFISARARKKIAVLGMLANACKDHSSPLDLKSSSEHIFFKNWRWAPLEEHLEKIERNYTKCFLLTLHVFINPYKNICCFYCLIDTKKCKKCWIIIYYRDSVSSWSRKDHGGYCGYILRHNEQSFFEIEVNIGCNLPRREAAR